MDQLLLNCFGFEWDQGNAEKNWNRHQVIKNECEQVFFNEPLVVADDTKHSQYEKRCYILGRTDADRLLFWGYALRSGNHNMLCFTFCKESK